ncbi:unnamed protein product [Ostreobium quekettii]|uniref:Uncharacterized protein n=1 Tax=Ostreobium quekettii TaxID=121088 RepID=A0A8S1J405_9CHLO|nr:unnamed protein product [Ostreobium quekettii]|eukprot:evm.model.scf_627.6 EVM.evm.TU.scf_627.6   scf_627:68851-71894(-)
MTAATAPQVPPPVLEDAVTRCKTIVYKNRIRLKEFFVDFDKLRCGQVRSNHFVTAMSIAGLDRYMSPEEILVLSEGYKVEDGAPPDLVEYRKFVEDVDRVFTLKGLETDPLKEVPAEPLHLLDKQRYQRSARRLEGDKDCGVEDVLFRVSDIVRKRGVLVKPMFDDAAADNHSSKVVGHVTRNQFAQCLNVKLNLELEPEEVDLLAEKFGQSDYPEMVNYVAFANTVDPREEPFDPYKLR